jgi:chromosome segregation ATPase
MANGDPLTYTGVLKEVRVGLQALGDRLGTVGEDIATLTERSQNTNRRLEDIETKINTICAAREKDREVVDKLSDRIQAVEGDDQRRVAWIAGLSAVIGGAIAALGNVIAKMV